MGGYNKDVKDFSYPSDFGFSGSNGVTTVRSHTRTKPQRYAEGGQVKDDSLVGKVKRFFTGDDPPATPPKPKDVAAADTIPAQKPASAADAIKNQRARQMKELGLKRGGKVKAPRGKIRVKVMTDKPVAMPSDPDDVTAPAAKCGGLMRKAMGGPVKAAKGGDIAQDKRMINSAIQKHVRAPKPRGHGVK